MIIRDGSFTYYDTPKRPLREVLSMLCGGKAPPRFVTTQHFTTQLSAEDQEKLHEWAVKNVKPQWLTGIGVLEAADAMVREAVANANIRGPEEGAKDE